jgi:hypothetical protein
VKYPSSPYRFATESDQPSTTIRIQAKEWYVWGDALINTFSVRANGSKCLNRTGRLNGSVVIDAIHEPPASELNRADDQASVEKP